MGKNALYLRTYYCTLRAGRCFSSNSYNRGCNRLSLVTEYRSVTEGPLSGATCPRFFMQKYAVYWPEGEAASQYSVFIGQKMS
jgi:hypothetical protein